jgi:hypothetical protein
VIDLASYAPLLSNVDFVHWTPDLIWFDNDEAYAASSYHVQKLSSENSHAAWPRAGVGPASG